MKKNIIKSLFLALALSIGFSSCEDMLTPDMDRHNEADELATDTLYSYWGILRSLQGLAERYVILGECRGDLISGTEYVSDSINAILNFGRTGDISDGACRYLQASDFYQVINSCNAFLAHCDTLKVTGTNKSVMLKEYAQVASIRAWVYLQLVLTYGEVPYVTEPMLSTSDMEAYWGSNPPTVNADNLADKDIVKQLYDLRNVDAPDYGYYGRVTQIVHATKCIFPQNLVLGDIYLLQAKQGDVDTYKKAAKCYYDFLNTKDGGCIRSDYFYGTLTRNQATEQLSLGSNNWLNMFSKAVVINNTTKGPGTLEIVTVIPSSKNKLWGAVNRGVNELFGFTTEISVHTAAADTSTTADISLSLNYQRELSASRAYVNLNHAQTYETYISNDEEVTPITDGFDARLLMATTDYLDLDDTNEQVNFIQKQNPGMQFSTTFPVIYRMGSIWLRYAMALNGAGFPGYAFAILKSGLCGNTNWLPTDESDYAPASFRYYDSADSLYYESTDSLIYRVYQEAPDSIFTTITDSLSFEEFQEHIGTLHDYESFSVYAINYVVDSDEEYRWKTFAQELRDFYNNGRYRHDIDFIVKSRYSFPNPGLTSLVCNHIPMEEMKAAPSTGFLNFETLYLRGNSTYQVIDLAKTQYEMGRTFATFTPGGSTYTMGIHSRGCGLIEFSDKTTSFNYVNQINKMLYVHDTDLLPKDSTGQPKSANWYQIYNPDNREKIQIAIADLILDEMALETCFEGNRFFDLVCFSRFRGDNDQLAKRVAFRGGEEDAALRTFLQNDKNWYFKLPNR